MTPVRVILLDPSKAMEQAATAIFAGDHTVHVESRSGGAQVLNALVGANAAQIVVLPPALATQTALADLHEFAHRNPMVDLVMVSSQKDPDLMVQALRCGIREFVFEPFQNSELRAVIKRLAVNQLSGRRGAGHHAEVVAFIPCKGGAGASFLATNLAHVLVAKHHKKVLLIDLNLQFGDAFLFLMDKLLSRGEREGTRRSRSAPRRNRCARSSLPRPSSTPPRRGKAASRGVPRSGCS